MRPRMQSALVLANHRKYHKNNISLKTRFLGLHFCRKKFRCISSHFYVMRLKATEFSKITHGNWHLWCGAYRWWSTTVRLSCWTTPSPCSVTWWKRHKSRTPQTSRMFNYNWLGTHRII